MADKCAGAAKLQQHQFKPSRKNGWVEHRLVVFANPPTFTGEVGRNGDVGRGTYIGDGSDVLTDPEPAGHRWLPSAPRLRTAAWASRHGHPFCRQFRKEQGGQFLLG